MLFRSLNLLEVTMSIDSPYPIFVLEQIIVCVTPKESRYIHPQTEYVVVFLNGELFACNELLLTTADFPSLPKT